MEDEKSNYLYKYNLPMIMINFFLDINKPTSVLPPLDEVNNVKLNTFYNNMTSPGSTSTDYPQNIDNTYVNCNIR